MTWLIQVLNLLTRVYMAGACTLQLLVPQETIPMSTQVFPFWQTRGPPESPCKGRKHGSLGKCTTGQCGGQAAYLT